MSLLQHMGSSLWHAGFSLVAVHELSCPTACGIVVPLPGIRSLYLALESGFLTHWTTKGSPYNYILNRLKKSPLELSAGLRIPIVQV